MKNLYLILAASLFLFGCGTNYLVGNSGQTEATVNDVKIAANQCEYVKLKSDEKLEVEGVANSSQEPGDKDNVWIWSGSAWSEAADGQCETEKAGQLVVNPAVVATDAGSPAGGDPPATGQPPAADTKTAAYIVYKHDDAKEACKDPKKNIVLAIEGASSPCEPISACKTSLAEWKRAQESAGYTCQEEKQENLDTTPCKTAEQITHTCTKQQGS